MKASDITDLEFLAVVADIQQDMGRWVYWWDIEELWPTVPPKVIRAKGRKLMRRGLVTGCQCLKCRGDLELTTHGTSLITAQETA